MRFTLLYIFLLTTSLLFAQNWHIEEVGNLPFKTSNNAIALAIEKGQPLIYSFGGIDTTLKYSGIHLKTGAVSLNTGESIQFADMPDTLGKVAAGASTVKNKIYVIGGYHVYANGSELSSNKVHCFNATNGTWEADKTNIPVAIDDHVQAIWNDSLIYIITGWSDSKNVPNVQIFNPTANEWTVGTSVPNNNQYNAFGASGTIIGNTIYYLGGASMGNNFPSTFRLRIGEINPLKPKEIEWRDSLLSPQDKYYRAACANVSGFPTWFGGSTTTYNYNGLSYSTGSGVNPSEKSLMLLSSTESLSVTTENLPMDIRGVGSLNSTTKVLAGGMLANQEVTDKVIKLRWGYPLNIEATKQPTINVYPNPVRDVIHLSERAELKVYSTSGKLVYEGNTKQVNTDDWSDGLYFIATNFRGKHKLHKVVKSSW